MSLPSPTEVVQSAYAAFGRGDIAGLLDHLTDDVDWTFHGSSGLAYMGRFAGKAEVQRWFGLVAELDGIEVFEPREFLEGSDHVTVIGRERTRALLAGDVFESPWMHVFSLHDGRISRFVGCFDTAASDRARTVHAARA